MQGVDVLTEQTQKFIDENPTELVLTRSTIGDDGAGGTIRSNPVDLAPLTVRVVPQVRAISTERRTIGGETVTPDISLVCLPDSDIARGDTYTFDGVRYEVIWINRLPYELICEVYAR